jgi:VWFA-related protein
VRFNAHVTFSTAADILEALGNVQDRRKAFVYVSNGYDFNPFSEARLQKIKDNYAQSNPNYDPTAGPEAYQSDNSTVGSGSDDPTNVMNQDYKKRNEFSISDLVGEIAQLTRIAQRSNVTFYTIDPRGLIGTGSDASVRAEVKYGDWRDFFEMQHSTLQTLAEETGGFAAVDTNDFDRVIRRIDAETSDYYLIGYTSSNPDPFKIRRFIKIEVTRPNLQPPIYRSEYTLPRPKGKPPAPAAPQSPSQK